MSEAALILLLLANFVGVFVNGRALRKLENVLSKIDVTQWGANIELIGRLRNAHFLQEQKLKEQQDIIKSLRKGFQA